MPTSSRTSRAPVRDALADEAVPRRVLRRTLLRITLSWVGLTALYAAVPIAGRSGISNVLLMVAGLGAFAALVAWQLRQVVLADYPKMRAFEALALVIPVLIMVFAYTYASVSNTTPGSFSEDLSRIDAAYFATTTFATVGFGDITAQTEATRLLVTLQMIVGLVAFVGLARLMLSAASLGLRIRGAGDEHQLAPAGDDAGPS